jgi:linoleoyl-CoA desaturase
LSHSALKQNPVKSLPFTKQLGFRKAVVQRVEAYLKANNLAQRDLPAMYAKTATIMGIWAVLYALLLLGGFAWPINLGLCLLFSLATAGIGFNIMHDANHGGYSNSARINKIMGFSLELLGTSAFVWRQQHNVWHHTYTNIFGMDSDVEAQGVMRITPRDEWRPHYRFQHLYSPLVYGMLGFSYILRDFTVFLTGSSDAKREFPQMTRADRILFVAGKLMHFTIMLGMPLLVFAWWQVLIAYVLNMFTISLTLASILPLAHLMQSTEFPEPVGDPLHIDNEWAIHEVETTVNFGPRNKFLNWYSGGLNFQIEHHLFPQVCHIHYPQLAPIVQATCAEFGVAYNVYPTWSGALIAHLKTLKWLGEAPANSMLATTPPYGSP